MTAPTSSPYLPLIFDAAPVALMVVDQASRIERVNRALEQLFGYEAGELAGELLERLLPERHRPLHAARVAEYQRKPSPRAMRTRRDLIGRCKDGSELMLDISLAPLTTPSGSATLAAVVELSEYTRSDARFRLAVEAAPNAMVMVDDRGRISLVNHQMEELYGGSRDELIGQPLDVVLPARHRGTHRGHVSTFHRQPSARPMGAGRELYLRRRDDTEVPVEIGLTPLEMPDGLATLASIVDIRERRRTSKLQRELAAIVEYNDDAIIGKTLDGIITSVNRGAQVLYGYSAAELLGRSVLVLVPEALHDEERTIMARIGNNTRVENYATVRRCKDGRELEVSITLSPILDDAGVVVGASSIARDITEARRRDAELQRSNAELEQFAYVASHDLQEPLRMVANFTELLAERYRGRLDERADKYIHFAVDGARRMQRLVADLLAYSRVDSQGKQLGPVSSEASLMRVLRTLQPLIVQSGATVEHHSLPTVWADEVQLDQLFQNLIGNALKFRTELPPRVAVEAVLDGKHWRFSVADNGIGIDMKYANRIFQMFQRLHEVGRYEGSGIGLAISKRIVERHGGRIWFDSTPRAGSTFYFSLQAAAGGES